MSYDPLHLGAFVFSIQYINTLELSGARDYEIIHS